MGRLERERERDFSLSEGRLDYSSSASLSSGSARSDWHQALQTPCPCLSIHLCMFQVHVSWPPVAVCPRWQIPRCFSLWMQTQGWGLNQRRLCTEFVSQYYLTWIKLSTHPFSFARIHLRGLSNCPIAGNFLLKSGNIKLKILRGLEPMPLYDCLWKTLASVQNCQSQSLCKK